MEVDMVAIEVVDRVVNMEVNKLTGMVMQCITELTNRVKIEVDKVVDMVVNMEVDKVVDKVAVMVDDRQKNTNTGHRHGSHVA